MRTFLSILFLGLASFGPLSSFADTYTVSRPDASVITYYLDAPPGATSFPLLVLLQGSQCGGVKDTYNDFKMFLTGLLKVGVVSVEKPGFPAEGPDCPKEYFERNTIDQRIDDYKRVIAQLRTTFPQWNKKLIWLGGSEGATVGALVSPQIPETAATILLAGGGGMTMADELLLLRKKEMDAQGAPPAEIENALNEMRAQYETIYANPTSELTWYGDTNTYKWWNSILKKDVFVSLKYLATPVYLVQGTIDTSVPVESTDLLVDRLKTAGKGNFTYVRREGLTHSWKDSDGRSHFEQIFSSAAVWLMTQEDQALRLRFMEIYRNNPNDPELQVIGRQIGEVDLKNQQALKVLISRAGFPLISTHGHQANRDAWLLVQHADQDLPFQKQVLQILEDAHKAKDTSAPDLAYLTDRVMVNERLQNGQEALQRFGSQGTVENGCWVPRPIEDESRVDERRAQYELGTLADYKRLMNEVVGHPECNKDLGGK